MFLNYLIFSRISSFPFQSRDSLRTSLIVEAGMIFIFLKSSFVSKTSFSFDFGIITLGIRASIAASTFCVMPPTARTSPLTDNEPVNAVSCLIGICFRAEIIEVATAIDAESPSTPDSV